MALKTRSAPGAAPRGAPHTSPYAAALSVVGWLLLLLGERIAGMPVLTALGAAAMLAAVGWRVALWVLATGDRKRPSLALFVLAVVGAVAFALCLAATAAGRQLLGIGAAKAGAQDVFGDIVGVGWLVLMLMSLLPTLLAEVALAGQHRAARVEPRRVMAAVSAGIALALAASYGALFTFAAGRADVKVDFSYFRTAKPGESTRKIVATLEDPLKVTAFFPDLNEVGAEVQKYLRDLAGGSDMIDVRVVDADLYPEEAKAANVTPRTGKGTVVVAYADQKQTFDLDVELKKAQPKLKTLDGEFQKALLAVVRPKRTAYLTVGHDELNTVKESAEGRGGSALKKVLEWQGYLVKDLGMAQGLGREIPDDATVVFVIGPQKPFLPEELEALEAYAGRGGRLFLALDPEGGVDQAPLARLAGLAWQKGTLCNDKYFRPLRRNDADRASIGTDRFSSHPSVSTVSQAGKQGAVFFYGAAGLDKLDAKDEAYKIDFTVKAMTGTWLDLDGNFKLDKDAEKQSTYNLVAAVTRAVTLPEGAPAGATDEMRAVVVGDAEAFADAWIVGMGQQGQVGLTANGALFGDSVRWLGGEESFIGAVETTEDVPIEHTKGSDQLWFYLCIVAVPGLVGGLGFLLARRARREGAPGAGRGAERTRDAEAPAPRGAVAEADEPEGEPAAEADEPEAEPGLEGHAASDERDASAAPDDAGSVDEPDEPEPEPEKPKPAPEGGKRRGGKSQGRRK
ncbi:MAG: Gldg family protein [Polyangiaceae bacterium]|nr:Gldg family protein [Polyangiaceae bacterium]